MIAVKLENDQFKIEKRCHLVERPIKGELREVQICTVERIPTNIPDSNSITAAQIHTVIDAANNVWSKYDYEFSLDENTDYIVWHSSILNRTPSSDLEWQKYADLGNALALLSNPGQDRVVVMFRNEGGQGWSWGSSTTNYVSMPNISNLFLDHEMGHYFGLVHTFYYDDCTKVTLTNTDNDVNGMLPVANDDVGDTAADPTKKCLSSNFCVDTTIKINGIIFNPPLHNVMSYYGCQPVELSPEQIKAIKYNLKNDRSEIPILKFK